MERLIPRKPWAIALVAVVGIAAVSAIVFGETYSGFVWAIILAALLLPVGLVTWAVIDVAQRPPEVLPSKTGWLIALVAGTLLAGPIGLIVALIYLLAVRPSLNRM